MCPLLFLVISLAQEDPLSDWGESLRPRARVDLPARLHDYPVLQRLFSMARSRGVTLGIGAGTARDVLLGAPASPLSDIDLIVDSREARLPGFKRAVERAGLPGKIDYYVDLNPASYGNDRWVDRPRILTAGLTIENLAVMADGSGVDPTGRGLADLKAGRLHFHFYEPTRSSPGLGSILRTLRFKAQYPDFEFTPHTERELRRWISIERRYHPREVDPSVGKNLRKLFLRASSPERARELLDRYGLGEVLERRGLGVQDASRPSWRGEAAGLGHFAAAYLLKEAMNGRIAVGDLAEPRFWGGVAAFTGAARATEFGLSKVPMTGIARGLSKAALPLAAGMAAVQLLSGRASLKDLTIDTGAYLAAGLAVNLVADALIYPLLFAAGPPGWIAAGLYTVGKLAVTLYLGEKLSGWLKELFRRPEPRDGLRSKIDAINP